MTTSGDSTNTSVMESLSRSYVTVNTNSCIPRVRFRTRIVVAVVW
jgi:hypothetical protein